MNTVLRNRIELLEAVLEAAEKVIDPNMYEGTNDELVDKLRDAIKAVRDSNE